MSISAACSLATASVSTFLVSAAGVGEDFPEEAGVEDWPLGVLVVGFSVFSIALAATTLAPSSTVGASSLLFGGAAGVVSVIERTLALPTEPSAPIDKDLTTGGPELPVALAVDFEGGTDGKFGDAFDSLPVGRLAIMGVLPGVGFEELYVCWGMPYC